MLDGVFVMRPPCATNCWPSSLAANFRYSQQASAFFDVFQIVIGSTCQNIDVLLLPLGMWTTSNFRPPFVAALSPHICGRNHGPSTFIAARPFWMPKV